MLLTKVQRFKYRASSQIYFSVARISQIQEPYAVHKAFICEDDYLTADGKLKIRQGVSNLFGDECSFLAVNASFLEKFGVSNDRSRLDANIDVQAIEKQPDDEPQGMGLWSIRVPNPDEKDKLTWCS